MPTPRSPSVIRTFYAPCSFAYLDGAYEQVDGLFNPDVLVVLVSALSPLSSEFLDDCRHMLIHRRMRLSVLVLAASIDGR
jgi:hypothetical protein